MSKPKFDPSKDYEEVKPKFDPSAPFESDEKVSVGKALGVSIPQGLTMGFADEIGAGLQAEGDAMDPTLQKYGITNPTAVAAIKTIGSMLTSPSPLSETPDVNRELAINRQELAQAREERPWTSLAGEVGGTLANPLSYLFTPAKGARLITKAATYAVPGAIYGYGGSEREGGDRLQDAAYGAAFSSLFGTAQDKLVSFAKRLPEIRNRRALKALGAGASQIKLDEKMGGKMGQEALDRGLLQIGQSTDQSLAKAEDILAAGKDAMDDVFTTIDATGRAPFDPINVAEQVHQELMPTYKTPYSAPQANAVKKSLYTLVSRVQFDENPKIQKKSVEKVVNRILKGQDIGDLSTGDVTTMEQARGIEKELRNIAYPGGKRPLEPKPSQSIAMQTEAIVSDAMNDAAESVLGPTEPLQEAKRTFQVGKTTSDMLRNKLASESAHKLTLSDAWNVPLNAIAGPKVQAVTLNNSVLKFMLEKTPQFLGKYMGPLSEAYMAGPTAVEAVHQHLMGDPEYIQMTQMISTEMKSNPSARTHIRNSIEMDPTLSPVDKAKQLSDINSNNF